MHMCQDQKTRHVVDSLRAHDNTSDKLFDRYYGQFCDGQSGGYGVYEYAIGDRCEGRFYSGRLHGPSVYTWAEGAEFSGNWADSQVFWSILNEKNKRNNNK